MKILIVGEYSGFSNNLAKGFALAGHHTFVFSWGDVFKKIQQEGESYTVDVSYYRLGKYYIPRSNRLRKIVSAIKLRRFLSRMSCDWDCALIINPAFIRMSGQFLKPQPTLSQIKRLLKSSDKIYLSACGNDFIFNSYLPFREKGSEYITEKFLKNIDEDKKTWLEVVKNAKGIIPVMIDYADAYRYFKDKYNYHLYKSIPLPFDTNSANVTNDLKNKIVVMHGVTRPKDKGSDFIIPALNRLQKDYPDKVEVKIVYHLPLEDYLKVIEQSNIIIDQCYAYSYGMNAIEAMAMGKVVLSGNELGNAEEFGQKDCPVINIHGDSDEIYSILVELIKDANVIKKISKKSRDYAVNVHNCRTVAQQYIETFLK